MKKIILSFLCLTLMGQAKAEFNPIAQWQLFAGDYAFIDNAVNKKINFGGGQDVTAIADDPNGHKIFAVANKGIFLFDGKQMQALKMPANFFDAHTQIISLACDSKNTIWIGTTSGLMKFENNALTNIPMDQTKLQVITDIVITATDKVYISGLVMGEKSYVGAGVSFFNGSAWTNYSKANTEMPDNLLSDLMIDANGFLWAIPGMHDMGLVKFDGKVWKHINNSNGLPTNMISAMTMNKSGKIFLGSPKGIIEQDGATWTMKPFSNSFSPSISSFINRSQDAASLEVNALAIEDNGTVWVGTKNMGLFSFSQGGLKVLDQQNSPLLSNAVLHIHIDKNAFKWVVAGVKNPDYALYAPFDAKNRTHTPFISAYGGVTVYKEHGMITNNQWTVYDSTTAPMNIGTVMAINEDAQQNIWFTNTAEGLIKLKNGQFEKFKHTNPFHSAFTAMYLAPDNKIYLAATMGGVKVFENGVISDYAKNPNMGGVNGMVYDKDNTMWVSGTGGLSHFVNNDWQTFNKKDGLPSVIFYCITKDSKNKLWAGSAKGLVTYDTAWQVVGKDVDFPSNDFTAMAEDAQGKLWLGTNKGISIYDGTTFTNIPKIESLNINKFIVNGISIGKNNTVWLATESYGVLKFDGTNWTQFSKKNTGALYDKITAIKMAADGKLYVASATSDFNEFAVNLPTQDPIELLNREIIAKIKRAEPKRLFTVIQMN